MNKLRIVINRLNKMEKLAVQLECYHLNSKVILLKVEVTNKNLKKKSKRFLKK